MSFNVFDVDPFSKQKFLGLNPTANGLLIGGLLGGPVGLAVGGAVGGIYDYMQGQKRDAQKAYDAQYKKGVENQNQLVNQNYQKKLQARGLGDLGGNPNPTGGIASQTGTALTTPTGEATNILG